MEFTRWDGQLFWRAATVAAVGFALGVLVTGVSDEGGVAWVERVARTLPLVPLCAALGTWAALSAARARGETVALAAVGRSDVEVGAAAVAGGAAVAALAAATLVVAPGVDASPFFPRAPRASAWVWQSGAFVDRGRGFEVGADGVPRRLPPDEELAQAAIPPLGRPAAGLAVAFSGAALPLLVAQSLLARTPAAAAGSSRRRSRSSRRAGWVAALLCMGALATSLVLFQAAAARQWPAWLGTLPTLGLFAYAVRRYRGRP